MGAGVQGNGVVCAVPRLLDTDVSVEIGVVEDDDEESYAGVVVDDDDAGAEVEDHAVVCGT